MRKARAHPNYLQHQWVNRLYGTIVPLAIIRGLTILSTATGWLAGALIVVMPFVDPTHQKFPAALVPLARWLNERLFTIVSVLVLVDLCSRAARWLACRLERFDVRKLGSLLDALVDELFSKRDVANHQYRATLFQARSCWGLGRWLGIVTRSGHTYTRKSTIFSIDANVESNNTGFVGECWRRGTSLIGPVLPDVNATEMTDEGVVKYKSDGWLADEEFDNMQVKSRIFLAACVRVDGRPWGVLVLDSTDEQAKPNKIDEKKANAVLVIAAEAISQLVR